MDSETQSPPLRIRKSSRNVTLVLLGAAALTSCGPGNRYDNSWGGDAPGSTNSSRSSSYYGSHYYGGYGNNHWYSSRSTSPTSTSPTKTSPSSDGVSRGGFGSKSSFHSSGS